jgi:hypothetical protein
LATCNLNFIANSITIIVVDARTITVKIGFPADINRVAAGAILVGGCGVIIAAILICTPFNLVRITDTISVCIGRHNFSSKTKLTGVKVRVYAPPIILGSFCQKVTSSRIRAAKYFFLITNSIEVCICYAGTIAIQIVQSI